MIPAESLIAKAVTAVVSRGAAALASLPFNKRKKACRALTKLYYAVLSLEEATDRLLDSFSGKGETRPSEAFIAALVTQQHSIEVATNAFVDLSHELQRGLLVLDPALAECCSMLYQGKGDFLSFMSSSIDINLRGKTAIVTISCPNARILSTDFEDAYRQSKEAVARGERYYWPSGAFDYFNDFEEVVLEAGDDATAANLVAMIRDQHALLEQAREQLRVLLKESFSVEELLFHPDRTPK